MSLLDVKQLMPGMVTEAPVKTKSGQLIISEGVELDNRLIARLDFYSISSVMITQDSINQLLGTDNSPEAPTTVEEAKQASPIAEPSEIKPDDKEPKKKEEEPVDTSKFLSAGNASYSQKIKRSDRFKTFQVGYTKNVMDIKNHFQSITEGGSIDLQVLLSSSMSSLNEQHLNSIELFDMLHNMRQINDSIYAHCLNVAFIARTLGKWLKYEKRDLQLLTLAGLLHDIGKIKIPENILNKPGKLTPNEYEIIKMHPQFGYEILSNLMLPDKVLNAVLHHHERCDGSGYPNKLQGDELDDFTMIIAIADVYDAMTAARSYRGPLCPFTVIESFENEGLQKYRPHVILTFLERIANTYQSNRVMLDNGVSGTIILLNNAHLSRPIIRTDNDEFIDLSANPSLHITSIL